MHTKALSLLLLSAFALAQPKPEPKPELEKKQNSGDAYYSSMMDQLHSLEQATSSYPDVFTSGYSMPSISVPPMSTYPDNPMTTKPPKMPQGGNQGGDSQGGDPYGSFEMPPPSIESVLATAIPPSYISEMQNPTARASIFSEMHNGHFPSWYQNLPPSVKQWIATHYAHIKPNAAVPPAGLGAALLAGAASILALALYL